MDTLNNIVREEVSKYAGSGRGANIRLFPILDDDHQIYAVNTVDYPQRGDSAGVVILARVVENFVVIEEDATDRKLVDALMQRGIARSQIVLAYAGEPLPDAAQFEV